MQSSNSALLVHSAHFFHSPIQPVMCCVPNCESDSCLWLVVSHILPWSDLCGWLGAKYQATPFLPTPPPTPKLQAWQYYLSFFLCCCLPLSYFFKGKFRPCIFSLGQASRATRHCWKIQQEPSWWMFKLALALAHVGVKLGKQMKMQQQQQQQQPNHRQAASQTTSCIENTSPPLIIDCGCCCSRC